VRILPEQIKVAVSVVSVKSSRIEIPVPVQAAARNARVPVSLVEQKWYQQFDSDSFNAKFELGRTRVDLRARVRAKVCGDHAPRRSVLGFREGGGFVGSTCLFQLQAAALPLFQPKVQF
jgi:hypothetical protein